MSIFSSKTADFHYYDYLHKLGLAESIGSTSSGYSDLFTGVILNECFQAQVSCFSLVGFSYLRYLVFHNWHSLRTRSIGSWGCCPSSAGSWRADTAFLMSCQLLGLILCSWQIRLFLRLSFLRFLWAYSFEEWMSLSKARNSGASYPSPTLANSWFRLV